MVRPDPLGGRNSHHGSRSRQPQQQRRSSRTLFSFSRVSIALCCVALFALNLFVLVFYIPRPTVDEAGIEKKTVRKRTHADITRPPRQDCLEFGCPIYPPELTTQLIQSLWTNFASNVKQQQAESFEFGSEQSALLSRQGESHTENQDRGVYISPFLIGSSTTPIPSFLIAIFDGHGQLGHLVAQQAVEKLPRLLAQKLQVLDDLHNDDDAIAVALNQTFLETDASGSDPEFFLGGCTASVTLRLGNKLYLANAGDSQTIVVSATTTDGGGGEVVYATTKDKPNLPEEHERITKMGGFIGPQGLRVLLRSEVAHDMIGLAMSRSLGDWEWGRVGVTAEPRIHVMDLEPYMAGNEKLFLLAASDGLWDVRPQNFYANQFAEAIRGEGQAGVNDQHRLLARLLDIIQKVAPKGPIGYKDDITAILARIE